MKRIAISVLLALVFLGGVFAQAQSDLQILAVVKLKGSEPVTLGALKSRVKMYQQITQKELSVSEKNEVLQGLINEKLLLQAAEKENIIVNDSKVNEAYLTEIASMVGQRVTEAQFEQMLLQQYKMSLDDFYQKRYGLSVAEYKKNLKKQLISQQYIIAKKGAELQKLSTPTHDEIMEYYENNQTEFVQPATATLFYVIIPTTPDSATQKKYADDLLDSVKTGKLTQEKMIEATQNGETKYKAGYVYVGRKTGVAEQLEMNDKEFASLYTRKAGSFSDVEELKSNGGAFRFYAIKEVAPMKSLTINDIIQPNTTNTVYKYIESLMGMEKQRQALVSVTQQITESLREGGSVQLNKSGDELDKILQNW